MCATLGPASGVGGGGRRAFWLAVAGAGALLCACLCGAQPSSQVRLPLSMVVSFGRLASPIARALSLVALVVTFFLCDNVFNP
eukprot:scaffold48056_cov29-Tisochrysis_lutea.AAC.2